MSALNRRDALALLLGGAFASVARAGEPKPVPSLQVLPLPEAQASFQRNGTELTRAWFAPELKRPFLYPVNGPAGRSLTRMGHPHDPETHSHHNSVWISHQNVGGVNFWEDRPGPGIAHRRVSRYDDRDTEALMETENAWLDANGRSLLRELRRTSVQALPDQEWLLGLDLQMEPPGPAPLEIGQSFFGLVGVRMAKTIGVADGGGTIRNSEGGVDEAGCFRKPARWCDYSGPIAPGVIEGITLLDHPSNPQHPVIFHVRNDGWMGACLTGAGPLTLQPGTPLRLRYALYIHAGMPKPEALQQQWETFAETSFREFPKKG